MWSVVGEGGRNIVFKYHSSQGSSDEISLFVLRVPKFPLEVLFSPLTYRTLVASLMLPEDEVSFFCPTAYPPAVFSSDALKLLLAQRPSLEKNITSHSYYLPNSLLAGNSTIEVKVIYLWMTFQPKYPGPTILSSTDQCSSCLWQDIKNKRSARCPLYLFNTSNLAEMESFFSFENSRVTFHALDDKFHPTLLSKVLVHSNLLKYIKESIDYLFPIFQSRLNEMGSLTKILSRPSYLAVLKKEIKCIPSLEEAYAAYMVYRTIRDCSFILNITCGKTMPPDNVLQWRRFSDTVYYSIQLIDLDEKFASCLPKYMASEQQLLPGRNEHTAAAKNTCWLKNKVN